MKWRITVLAGNPPKRGAFEIRSIYGFSRSDFAWSTPAEFGAHLKSFAETVDDVVRGEKATRATKLSHKDSSASGGVKRG